MRKLLATAVAAAALAGCGPAPVVPEQAPDGSLKGTVYGRVPACDYSTVYTKVSIEGHDYITARGLKCVAVVHSESCPCRAKK